MTRPSSKLLVSASAPLSGCAPRVSAVDSVVRIVSDFLDVSALVSLPAAAATGSIALFDRVAARHDAALASTADAALLRTHLYARALEMAIEARHLHIVKRVHVLHPQRLGLRSFVVAAHTGSLPILQWLCKHRHDGLCVCIPPATLTDSMQMDCCLRFAASAAASACRKDVLEWLIDSDMVQTATDAVMSYLVVSGDAERLKKLYALGQVPHPRARASQWLYSAAQEGHLSVVGWLCDAIGAEPSPQDIQAAELGGHTAVVPYLKERCMLPVSTSSPDVFVLLRHRHDLLKEAVENGDDPTKYTSRALQLGQYDILKWLLQRCDQPEPVMMHMMPLYEAGDHVDLMQWIHDQGIGDWRSTLMDAAATYGQLDVVKWLHENRPEGCTIAAMDGAAANGHLDVVCYLHEHRTEGCSSNAMNEAAGRGYLETVKWLHTHRTEGCTSHAMDEAARRGKLDVVQWLHENRQEGCTHRAMDGAAAGGHFHVVKWLHEHRTEGCSDRALRDAMENARRLDIVMWLNENYPSRSQNRISPTRADDHTMIQWLISHNRINWTLFLVFQAIHQGKMWLLELFDEHSGMWLPDEDLPELEESAERAGHTSVLLWIQRHRARRRDQEA